MKRFRFPLDRVLAYRRLAAEAEQARLEQCAAQVRGIDDRIAALDRHQEGEQKSMRGMEAARNDVSTVSLGTYPNYRQALDRNRDHLRRRREQALVDWEQQRARSIAANQARELLEKAREMAQERWTQDFHRETEATAAELFLARWNRGVKR